MAPGDRTFWRGKNTDTFKPMSSIVTGLDPDALRVTIQMNDQKTYAYSAKAAIFGVHEFISRMSQYLTLYPGDVLSIGHRRPPENIKDGDLIEIEVSGIASFGTP